MDIFGLGHWGGSLGAPWGALVVTVGCASSNTSGFPNYQPQAWLPGPCCSQKPFFKSQPIKNKIFKNCSDPVNSNPLNFFPINGCITSPLWLEVVGIKVTVSRPLA